MILTTRDSHHGDQLADVIEFATKQATVQRTMEETVLTMGVPVGSFADAIFHLSPYYRWKDRMSVCWWQRLRMQTS